MTHFIGFINAIDINIYFVSNAIFSIVNVLFLYTTRSKDPHSGIHRKFDVDCKFATESSNNCQERQMRSFKHWSSK